MSFFSFIVFAFFVFLFFKRYGSAKINRKAAIAPSSIKPPPAGESLSGCDELEIKGESHYQDALIALFGPYTDKGHFEYCQADLVAEPSNPHDKNAIRCEIGGLLVGYVSRVDAADVGLYLKRNNISRLAANANVKGGWKRGARDIGAYGVTVEVSPDVLGS